MPRSTPTPSGPPSRRPATRWPAHDDANSASPVVNTPVKLAGFAVGLVALFGAAAGLGAAVGPVGPASADAATGTGHGGDPAGHGGDDAHGTGTAEEAVADTGELPAGLLVSEDGYALDLLADDAPRSEE